VPAATGEPITVYYPVPYASPPNLEIHDSFHNCRILEQRADGFRIVQDNPVLTFTWTARGVKSAPAAQPVAPASVAVLPAAPASVPAPVLPPPSNEPVPVIPANYNR
jgi:hypothetical protein